MTLLDLVTYFKDGGDFEEFCTQENLNLESEVIEIFAVSPLSIDSELLFVEIEKSEGRNTYIANSSKYENLFDFYYFLDAIEESGNMSSEKLTEALFKYAINDA